MCYGYNLEFISGMRYVQGGRVLPSIKQGKMNGGLAGGGR